MDSGANPGVLSQKSQSSCATLQKTPEFLRRSARGTPWKRCVSHVMRGHLQDGAEIMGCPAQKLWDLTRPPRGSMSAVTSTRISTRRGARCPTLKWPKLRWSPTRSMASGITLYCQHLGQLETVILSRALTLLWRDAIFPAQRPDIVAGCEVR